MSAMFTLFNPGENLNAQTAAPAPSRATLPVATAATLPRAPRVAAAILPEPIELFKEELGHFFCHFAFRFSCGINPFILHREIQ